MGSLKLRELFCKYNNIHIKNYESPYFEIELEHLGLADEYENLINYINKHYNNEQEYRRFKQCIADLAIQIFVGFDEEK